MTPVFPFLRGNFSIAGSSVPFFQLSLSATDALAHLSVARELIFDPNEIVLDELFQRDIDDTRVRKEIAPYLERDGEIKFFNSLVVVLLPQHEGRLLREYPIQTSNDETTIDGLHITNRSAASTLEWDPDKICAIIVDGQHRYSALRELQAGGKVDLTSTTVPVVALALHESVGFHAVSSSLLSTVRKIFIDLNRQARTVSKTRNVLLDDRDVSAISVRSMLESEVKPSEANFSERLNSGRIPLALVDWYSDKLKFDQGIHLTSILSLYQIIQDFLNIPTVDPYSYDKCKAVVGRYKDLSIDLDFSSTLANCIEHNRPFFLTTEDLLTVEAWFRNDWGPAFAHVLVNLAPYKRHISDLRAADLIDGELEIWAALDLAGKKTFEAKHNSPLDFSQIAKSVSQSKAGDLAFQVVFQRAVMKSFSEACCANQEAKDSNTRALAYAKDWVNDFNQRFSKLSENLQFWQGTFIRGDGSINPTKTAENAAAGMIILATSAPIKRWVSFTGEKRQRAVADFVANADDLENSRPTCSQQIMLKNYYKAWRSSVRKFLQDTQNIYGRTETEAISAHIQNTLHTIVKSFSGEPSRVETQEEEEELIFATDTNHEILQDVIPPSRQEK